MVEPKVPPRPRSPDLNPSELVIFLWGQLVYSQSINSVEELTGRVVGAILLKFGKIVNFFKGSVLQGGGGHRAQTCITHQGHFQHLL
jgi:hypothetical protein